ncbi:hypothetical protein BCR35DRAFT_353162 [Leucosporidium creatinivorum]|uniref:Rad60/SUMO-like domain-containing protein n=1 Tax=Leucosporidium creatinivorum TaxID=106004 RepID=A0A1Y2F1G5_9BASI|nr:hypothetical protein BCR35DRAFT_353162 [Leucosporidium creatinivorum]
MGSSSDIEFVTKPAEGRGQRTRRPARPRASVPSPISKKPAAAKATGRASKGKGKATTPKEDSPTPVPAPAPILEDSDSDLELLPSPRRREPSKPKSQAETAPATASTVLEIPSSSTAAIFSSDPPAPSLNAQLPRSASTSAALARPHPSSSSQTATKQDPVPSSAPSSSRPGFNKSSSAPTINKRVPAPKKKVQVGGDSSDELDDFFTKAKPAAKAQAKRVPGRRPGSSGAVPAATSSVPRPRKMVASDSEASDDSSSSVSSNSSSHSESSNVRDPSLAAAVKHSKLPDWTRNIDRGSLGQSGSAVRAAKGKGNRKKRRMDVDSDEEAKREEEEKKKRLELEDEDTDDSFASIDRKRKGKGKEKEEEEEPERERTRSLTPPAPVEARKVRDIVAETRAKTSSPVRAQAAGFTLSDSHSSDDDLSHLDPEMLRIRNQRDSAAQRRSGVPPTSDDDLEIMGGAAPVKEKSVAPASMVEDEVEDEQTEIRVSMVMDPERPASEAARRAFERVMPVQMGMKQSFSYLYGAIGDLRVIPDPLDSLVFTYRRNRLYPFGTPTALKIAAHLGAEIKCYTVEVWEKIEKAKREGRVLGPSGSGSQGAGASAASQEALPEAAAPELEQEMDDDSSSTQLFRLTIRGSATQSLSLAVKPSILLSSLLSKYCKKFEIPQVRQSKMWLEFDGEKLDSSKRLEDYEGEIEDEETMDVGEARG